MLGKTHLFYGVTAGAAVVLAVARPMQPLPLAEAILAGGFGGLLPDLDEPGSTISNSPRILGRLAQRLLRRATRHRGLQLLGLLAGTLIGLVASVLNVLSRVLSHLVRFVAGGHREGTHWLPVWVLLSLGIFILTAPLAVHDGMSYIGVGFSAGYLSHLAGDGCTRSGIPLVPHWGTRLHLLPRPLRIRTGSAGETIATLVYAAALAAIVAVTYSHARG